MPVNGYWIECIPVSVEPDTERVKDTGLYDARLPSIPDLHVTAASPDQAIDKLRDKLLALSRSYRMKGEDLPARDNPVKPPRNIKSERGWISVYVQVTEQDTKL